MSWWLNELIGLLQWMVIGAVFSLFFDIKITRRRPWLLKRHRAR